MLFRKSPVYFRPNRIIPPLNFQEKYTITNLRITYGTKKSLRTQGFFSDVYCIYPPTVVRYIVDLVILHLMLPKLHRALCLSL